MHIKLSIEIEGNVYEVCSDKQFGNIEIEKLDTKAYDLAILILETQLVRMVGEKLVLGNYKKEVFNN